MAKKTFVNPFATVGFNQGNYTPYEQQNLLDAEENDRLYQEYLNSGMAQQGFQPQDNSSAIGRGLTAGAAGVIEGQAQLANLMGIGDGQMVQYLQKINRNNARKKEYSIADMIPFASDYWTNTEGAAYDVANMLGSSGAMMAETAALMTGAGAIGGALGLGGGAAAAGGGFAGALSRGAGLAPNAVKKLAGKMAAAANNRGYTKLGKALEGPMGQMYALNILKTPIEVSSEAGSAGADALAEGADVWEARKRAGITALVQAPLLAMSNTIESANLGGLFSKEIGKKATKEAIISLLGDITKDGLQNAWEEGMQQSSQEYAAGKQSLLGVVNPFQWSPEALQEAAVGAVGGMALGGGNAMLGSVAGGRETQQAPNQEQPTQEPAPSTPAPAPTAAEEQIIDTDKITPKGARAFLETAQSEMPAGEEYNAITELLDTGSDEDIISKATYMGYGKKETPVKQEQPTQPVEQQVEQQAEQPVETPAPVEDWATAQINEAINMIPTQARAKLMNKDGSVNWDKVNSDQNVQKALNNPKGIETAIKAINGDEKARNTMKGWGAKKKAAIIHAAQQQMAGQENVQQPAQQEPAKPVNPVEQPAPKPEVKPAPQGDEQNAQGQNQNNGNQNQGVNPQPQQSQAPEADNQGQGQNGQVETVKPSSVPVQQFKDTLGDYVVDEYGFNNDNTRSYVHKSDDGKDVQRVATIQRTKDGKYSASKNSSDKMAEPKTFDTLEEAEAFIAGKKPSKPTTNTTAAKSEPKKEVKPETAPEPKPEKAAPAADENGVVPLEKGMGEEAMNARKDENSKKVLDKSEEIRSKQRNGEVTSKEAIDAINGLIKKYAKGKVKLINDAAIEQLETDKKLVKAHDQGAMNGLLQQFKAKIDNYIAEAQKLLDSKNYDKDTRSEIESFKGAIEGLLDEFVAKADNFKLKRLKQHDMVFLNAAKKVDRMLEAFDKAKAKAEQEQQQEQQEQKPSRKEQDRAEYTGLVNLLNSSIKDSFKTAKKEEWSPKILQKRLDQAYDNYGEAISKRKKWNDPETFPLAEKDAYEAHKAETMERFKEYEKQYNEAHQQGGQQQQAPNAEPDAQEGESNIGAYADSVLGEGFMADFKAQLAAAKKEEAKNKKSTKKSEPSPTDQDIENDVLEQQIAEQVDANDTVFAQIELAIDSISNSKEQGAARKFFEGNPTARNLVAERIKKGVELFRVKYQTKAGKDISEYYIKEADRDNYVKVPKSEAIVMSKVGKLEIKETTKDAMGKEKKAKYVAEISEDEDWEYADALEEGKIEGVKKGDKKAVNKIMDFLTIEFPADKGCPFDKNCKTWGEWVRKVALKGAQYHSEDALDVIFDTDKINLDQKTALSDYFDYLYKKYENKVEDKSRQKKDLEADMVEKPTQTVEAKQEIEVPAEQKAKDEAKQRAAEALKAAFANAKFKTTQVNKNDLDNFDSNIIKQIIKSGYIVLNDVGEKIYDGWKQTMTSVIDGLEDLALKYKNYAKRILDSVWDYLSNLPDKVSFAADQLEKTLTNIAASLDMALDLQSSGFSYRDAMNLLKSSNQKVYNRFKDYLGAAFRAIERYPRKNDIGGDSNVDVRAPEQSAQGNSGRGNGNGLEANSGNNGRGNQMEGGQTAQGETNQHVSGGQVLQAGGSAVSGSGPAASGAQSNQQSGTQKPDDSASMSGNSNGGRSSGTGKNGSTGNGGKLGQNRKKAQTEAERQARDASGKRLSELQFNKEPFKAADEQGIAKAVPTLLPEQLKDVVAIEKRLFKNNGKGMLVANGTGTGKTMTGLGEIVRFLQKGARKILIVVPSSNIRDNWVDDAAMVGLPSSAFATITTGKVAPDAINIITYKAFSENQNILKESWDLVVMDECQWVSSGAKSDENERTNTAQTLRAISGHERTGFEDYMQSKYRKEYRELKKLGDKLKKSRKALGNLVAQFGAFGQPVNQLKTNIKSMEDKQKALRRKLDITEQKERKEYDKRLLARKEDTRVLLLSATPFAYSNSIYYAEGLLFNYDKGSYEDYMVDQFGYERKQDGTVRIQRVMGTSIPMPNHILEARWHDMLVDSGAMINRRLEIQQDYNRRFVKVDGGIGAEIDKGFEILKDYRKGDLNQILAERFDYSKRCRLLEAIKADAAIPMIKEYLKQGKKVVVFHDYKSEEPVGHPFKLYQEELAELSQDARDEYERLRKEHPELFLLEVNAFHNVDQTLEQAFKGKMAAINGNISFDKRTQIVKAFNNDNSGLDIVSVVAEAGKEGISLHDTTGEHPRVLINLGMPTRPTSSIQIEGRIYRLGQKSNAQIRYLYTDTKIEQKAFVDYISARTRTAETLALGDASRNLDGAFAIGYLASKTEKGDFNAANDNVDTGGKLYDTMSKEELETAMKQMYEQLNADGAVDEDMKAKLAERIQELEDARNAKKREEILTEQNEKKVLATIKEAVAGNKVTKVADGVYVVEFVGGARNLWIDLNNSQAAILGQMTEEQKRSMLSAAHIKGSEYEIGGYYTKEAKGDIGAVVDIIRLTEVATTHTLDHEIMHFVHNVLLKTLEKQHLEKYFKMLLKKQIGEDAYNKLTEKERLAQCEEMEADAYAAFCAEERKPKNMVERFFWKMQKWLAQFAEKFGIETPMGIYIRVRSGEMYGGRNTSAATNVVQYSSEEVLSREENLEKDSAEWSKLVDEYRTANKQHWVQYNNSKLFDFMKLPLVLKLVGVPDKDLKVFGSFFKHSVNGEHPGMTINLLKQLPKAMVDPLFVYKGSKPDSVAMALELVDKNGSTVVVAVEYSKDSKRYGIINLVESAYGKDDKRLKAQNYTWISNALSEEKLLYLNKEKSTAWMQGIRGYFPMGPAYLSNALSNTSIKTEQDLVNMQKQYPARYQAAVVKAKTALGEEQLDGTIKFSVKPVDKIDGKGVPDNLDNVVDNKESLEDVKPHGSVQEALQDAQKLGEKNEEEGGIVVKEPKVDKSRDIGALDTYLHSPSHLAKKNPIFKAFYDIFKKAQSVQEKLRNRWLGQLDGAYKMLKSKEDADTYHNLMVDGELKAKEYSMQELANMGIKDNVAKAYLHTRQMIRNIWEKVNDAHRGLVYRTEKLSAKKVEELSKKPFVENIMVRVVKIGVDNTDAYHPLSEVKLNDKATYEVKYGQPHVFKDTKILTQEQLDELKANPYAHVVKEAEYKEVEGLKLFKAEVENVAPPIGKIAGYLPHIFEQWLVLVETEQGSVPVGSGKNVKEAVKIAESLQKDAPNVQFYIVPKMFNPSNALGEDVAEGSVGGASIVLSAEDFSRLEKSISNTFKMSLAEAREALKPVAKKEGKSRFLGSLLHRKGRVGYNTDIADSLSRYIYMTSRYVALQPAKVKTFSLFERTFHGTLGEDYSRTDQLAHVTKNYILHCNGTPNHLETLLTGWLNMIPFWRNYVSTNFGDRSLMSITGRVNGLLSMSLLGGYNISSAVVGLSQLANVYARIGSRFLGEGMYAYKRMNLRDKRILAETGILYDIGLDTASGFTKRRKLLGGEGDSGLAKAYKFVAYYGDKGMYFFKKADEATRGIAALGAYYKGIEDGMSHKQAIAYAKKVNRDSNFDYGAADAPAIYQRLSGTGIGDLMLLFQKYPIKQFEFMQQMLPYFGSAKKAEKIRFWGAYFLMAGLAGIPLGDWLDELLAKVLGYKPTTAVKSYLFTEFGDNVGTRTLAYGVLSNLGVDVSRRIGMANLAPQGDSVWETALGPGLNILYRMAQSGSDDWAKTIKAFNPSLGNMAEGIRGYKTNSKNQINYIYGDMEKFFKAAGFRTTGESIASDLQSAVYLDKQQKKDARQKVLMEMVKKRLDGETLTNEDYKALREQKITPGQLKKAVSDAKMTALQRTRAGMTKQQKKDFAGTIVMEEDE